MALDSHLLEILVCPLSKMPLRIADSALLERLNSRIVEGRLRTRSGRGLDEELVAALVRVDGKVAYQILDDIPLMKPEESVEIRDI